MKQKEESYLEDVVLKLFDDQRQMTAFDITELVRKRVKEKIKLTEGSLYPVLHKMEADGLLTSNITEGNNRLRKQYSLATKGGKYVEKPAYPILIPNLKFV